MENEYNGLGKINQDIPEHIDCEDPYVAKKVAESKAFLEKHGFPEELLKKIKERNSK